MASFIALLRGRSLARWLIAGLLVDLLVTVSALGLCGKTVESATTELRAVGAQRQADFAALEDADRRAHAPPAPLSTGKS